MPEGVMRKFQRRGSGAMGRDTAPIRETRAEPVAVKLAPVTPNFAVSEEPVLRVRALSKSFRGLRALSQVTLEVRKGEILGLLGPNGSGKSTFINTVSGHYLPDGGEVWLDGRNITGLPAHRIARAGIARTYQIPRPFTQMSVLDNVALAAMYAGRGLPSIEAGRAEAMQWLRFTHLDGKAGSASHRA